MSEVKDPIMAPVLAALRGELDAQRLRADTAEAELLRTSDALIVAEQRIAELKTDRLPERKSAVDVFSTYGLGEVNGWNKCLDALGSAFGGE